MTPYTSAFHLTNGTSGVEALQRAGIKGHIIPWDDILHLGPIPDASDAYLRHIRATFLEEEGFAPPGSAKRQLDIRDARVARYAPNKDVYLWFEPDLYDQLQLAQVIDVLDRLLRPPRSIRYVPLDTYLSDKRPHRLQALAKEATVLTSAVAETTRLHWRAIRASTPDAIAGRLTRLIPELPYLTPALCRLAAEYPGADGLSQVQRQIVRALLDGPHTIVDLFLTSADAEPWVFLGDLSFAWYIRSLARGGLLTKAEALEVPWMNGTRPNPAFWKRSIKLSATGRRVAEGTTRALTQERWVGGVNVARAPEWRWTGTALQRA